MDLKPEPFCIAVVSFWEFAAIAFGRTPTVTNLAMRLPLPARRLVVGAAVWWLADHFATLPPVPRLRRDLTALTGDGDV